jgi:Ni/Co efflux regulator RcnB
MKSIALMITALALAVPLAVQAQTAAKPPLKERTKTAAKKTAQKVVPRRAIKRLEEKKPISQDTDIALSPSDLEVAKRIYTGKIPCELGASVTIEADGKKPGFFTLMHAGKRYRLHPVESRTGAIRLEDPRAGAMWLQLGGKSMLMSQKLGQRLADDCKAGKQVEIAEEMRKNPAPSLFEGSDRPAATKP